MGELDVIREAVRQAAARRRLERSLDGLWRGLLVGATLWLIALGLFKLFPIPSSIIRFAWAAPVVGALVGAVVSGWRRITLTAGARLIESRHDLQQRLSTALELGARNVGETTRHPDPTWAQLVIADAAAAIRGVDPRRLFPLHLPVFARWIPVVMTAVVGLGFVPEYRSASHLAKNKEARVVHETGRKMAQLIRQELKERQPSQEAIREAITDAANLGDRLAQANLTRADALSHLSDVAERLKEEARQLDEQPLLQKLREAARSTSPGSSPNSNDPALQKQLEKLQGSPGTGPDALGKLSERLQEAQKLASGMQGAAPDAAARQALSKALSQLAQHAGQLGLDANALNQALDAMKNLSIDRVLKDLTQAESELRQVARQAQDSQQLAEALESVQAAQQAIASNRAWQPGGTCSGGACAGCALHPNGRAGFGQGKRGGRGVGTWAPENGWLYYPEFTERWDNTGIQRPDTAPRGHTDRGDGKLSANAAPTRLTGQFSPGPMPSIPLKGVSIVGHSSVQYQQAVDAAQSDARSALNQDQVPRAYRGTVKDYFDDLK